MLVQFNSKDSSFVPSYHVDEDYDYYSYFGSEINTVEVILLISRHSLVMMRRRWSILMMVMTWTRRT